VSAHQRFLLTGVQVGLEPTEHVATSSSVKSHFGEKGLETKSQSVSRRDSSYPLAGQYNELLPADVGGVGDFAAPKVSYTGGSVAGIMPQWPIDECLGLTEFNLNYGFMDNGSSKVCLWLFHVH
jgi:hypothetical protein